METKIQIFKNEKLGTIRVAFVNGKIMFCGVDVAKALEYKDPTSAVAKHCKSGELLYQPHANFGGTRIRFIGEGDMYRLIMKSETKKADEFQTWVCDEVLPQIARTGFYSVTEKVPSYQIEDRIKRAERWIEEEKERLYLVQENEKLEKEKDKAVKESNYHKMSSQILDVIANTGESILVRKFAKMINDKVGVKMSQNTLYQFLREHGFVNQDKEPYQKWVDQGLFVVKWKFIKQVGKYKTTTFVTPLGQEYLSKYIFDKFSELEDEDTEFEYYEE